MMVWLWVASAFAGDDGVERRPCPGDPEKLCAVTSTAPKVEPDVEVEGEPGELPDACEPANPHCVAFVVAATRARSSGPVVVQRAWPLEPRTTWSVRRRKRR